MYIKCQTGSEVNMMSKLDNQQSNPFTNLTKAKLNVVKLFFKRLGSLPCDVWLDKIEIFM